MLSSARCQYGIVLSDCGNTKTSMQVHSCRETHPLQESGRRTMEVRSGTLRPRWLRQCQIPATLSAAALGFQRCALKCRLCQIQLQCGAGRWLGAALKRPRYSNAALKISRKVFCMHESLLDC